MKYLKHFESSDEDAENLLKSLKDLSHNLDRLKSYAQFKNRERLHKYLEPELPEEEHGKSLSKLSDEFRYYFTDLIDDNGWEYYMDHSPQFYSSVTLKKFIKKDKIWNLQKMFSNLVDRLTEIRDRLSDEGFQSKFMIYFNGKVQQDVNPNNYKVSLYNFKGLGDSRESYIREKGYDPNEYFYAEIKFAIV